MILCEDLEFLLYSRSIFLLYANEILTKIQSIVLLNSMMNVTGSKQLGIKDEESHCGIIDKAGIKNNLKKTEEWMCFR